MRFLAPRRPLALGMMLPSKGHKNWMFNFSVIGSRRKGVPEGFLATAKNGHLECNTNMQLYKVFVLHSTSHRCQPHVRHVRMSSERPAMFSRLKAAGWCSHVGAATSSWRLLPCSLDATPGFHLRQWRPWQRSKAPACTAYGKSWPRRGGRRRHIVRNPPVVPKYTTIPSKWVFLKKGSPKSIGQSRLDH